MSSTQFVEMYHPLIPSTATRPALVAAQAVDERYAKGWLLVDPDALPPAPATPYYTTAAADSRFVQDAQLATKMAGHVGDGSAFDLAQRAAFGAWLDPDGLPTLEELERVTLLGTVSATATKRLGPTSFDQRIGGLTLAVSAAVAASDTNYWTASLLRLRTGQNPLTIVSRTTKATGGEAFTADQGWNFDAMSWLETARHLRKGDVLALTFTKTGTPADLADLTVAVRYEPGVRPLIRDTFTRADSASSLGTTDTGQVWAPYSGTWGISGQQAYAAALSGGYAYATFDAGVSDCTISATLAALSPSYGIPFRGVDYDNMWELAGSGIWLTFGGSAAQIVAFPIAAAPGDVLSVSMSGPDIRAFKNGVQIGAVNDSRLQTATEHGVYVGGTTDGRWDDLELAV